MSAALVDEVLGLGPEVVFIVVGLVVAAMSGGAFPRCWWRLLGGVAVVVVAMAAAAATGQLMVEMALGGLGGLLALGFGLTRRGLLRLALVGFALGWLANVAVVVANGAMPFADEDGWVMAAPGEADGYEPITASTHLSWLADTIRVPLYGGLASPGDLLLLTSLTAGIIAIAHSPDGRGGTGRRRSPQWYHARYSTAMDVYDWQAAPGVVSAGLVAWPKDPQLRWDATTVAVTVGDYGRAADGALEVLDDADMPEQSRGRFLDGYADALLMDGDPATFAAAEVALGEAEGLLPGDCRLATSRALLALRRGDLDGAAAGARLVLGLDAPGEHPRARMVLLDHPAGALPDRRPGGARSPRPPREPRG